MVIESADPETGIITILLWAFTVEVWREDFDIQIDDGGWRAVWPILCGTYRSDFEYLTAESAVNACQICMWMEARVEYPDDLANGVRYFFVSKLDCDWVVVDESSTDDETEIVDGFSGTPSPL